MELNNNQKLWINNQPHLGNKLKINLGYESDYEIVKTNPNKLFEQYKPQLDNLVGRYIKKYQMSGEEIWSDIYIQFLKACEQYTPFYNGNFYPAQNYIMNNLNSYMLNYLYVVNRRTGNYGKFSKKLSLNKRISDNDDSDFISMLTSDTNIEEQYNEGLYDIIKQLPENYQLAIKLLLQGLNQEEIAKQVGLSQSRICIMFLQMRQTILEIDAVNKRPKYNRFAQKKIAIELYNYCHNYNNYKPTQIPKVKYKDVTDINKQEIIKLKKEGERVKVICNKFGISTAILYHIINEEKAKK